MKATATALPPLLRVRVPEQAIKFTGFSIKLDEQRGAVERTMSRLSEPWAGENHCELPMVVAGQAISAERSLSTL